MVFDDVKFNGIKLGYRSIRVFFHVFSEILISAFKPAGLINLKVLFLLSFTEPDFPCKVYIAGDKYAGFDQAINGAFAYHDGVLVVNTDMVRGLVLLDKGRDDPVEMPDIFFGPGQAGTGFG